MKSGGKNKNGFPKVLVISHNCFSLSQSNGRTLESLFSNWNPEHLSQIYVYNNLPDSNVCKKFFKITEKDLITSLVGIKNEGNQIDEKINSSNTIAHKKSKKSSTALNIFRWIKTNLNLFYIFSREFVWYIGKWNSKLLNSWITKFKPDVIFLFPGEYPFIFRISNIIAKRYNIPIILFISENHYIKYKKTLWPPYHFYKLYFTNTFNKTLKYGKTIIFSNELLMMDFKKKVDINGYCILTTSDLINSNVLASNNKLKISYAGNLGHERWKSLIEIGKILKSIDSGLEIEVYSGFLPQEARKHFTTENGINFCGAVSYEKVKEVIQESEIVLHVEGFSEFTKWDIKHGFSTKIADLLSSGKCFLMYGPKEIACVDYLLTNQAAWVASNKDELKEILHKIVGSEKDRKKFLNNAEKLVEERHNKEKNALTFEVIIRSVCEAKM